MYADLGYRDAEEMLVKVTRVRKILERKLIDCLTSLGRDVEIVVKDMRRADGTAES